MNISQNERGVLLKAPFRTNFSLKEGNILAAGKYYPEFWKKIKEADLGSTLSKNRYSIEYLHLSSENDEMQFESVSSDSNLLDAFSPRVIEIVPLYGCDKDIFDFCGKFREVLPEKFRDKIQFLPGSLKITIFKNTLANIDLFFRFDFEEEALDEDLIPLIEKWSNKLTAAAIHFFYNDIIKSLVNRIKKLDHKWDYISNEDNHYGFPDINESPGKSSLFNRRVECAKPLWVSRILFSARTDEMLDDLVQRWIITTKAKEEITEQLRNGDMDEKNQVYLGWMHSLMLTNRETDVIEDACETLSIVQYYYAILDSIGMNLSQIIGISHKKMTVKETKQYKSFLEEMLFITSLIKTEFTDVTQSMQRNRAFFLNDLMDKWTVDNLFENVDNKIQLCKDNIDKIYQKAFNRSQKVAELLLFFISGFAILEFLKGLSEFFWSPDNYKEEVWGLYALGKAFDPNSMLWFGIVIFLLLFFIYTTIINKQK